MIRFFSLILLFTIISPHFAYAGVNTHALAVASASSQSAVKQSPAGLPNGSQARSVCAWVKTTTASETYAVGYGGDTTAGQFDLTTDVNLISIRQNGGNHRWTATNVTDGNWHFICVTYPAGSNINSVNVDAYMDTSTALTDSSSGSGVTNTLFGCIRLGADSGGGSGACTTPSVFFNGNLDDVQVWDKQLSGAEVLTAKDGCNLSDSATNLVGRWRLDNDYVDSTANANNLTAVNAPTFVSPGAYTCAVVTGQQVKMTIINTKMVTNGVKVIKP